MKDLDKFLGVMFGGAVGDALGSVTEFLQLGSFPHVEDFQGRPKFRSNPGDYTDDTAQALCLAQSLLDCKGFNIEDQLDKYLKRIDEGYMSSQDRAFGIGLQTMKRLYKYKQYKEGKIEEKPWEEDLSGKKKDGNGSLMKIGPIPLFYYSDPEKALYYSRECCKAHHNTDICMSCAEYFVGLVLGALQGEPKSTLKDFYYSPVANYWNNHKRNDVLLPIMKGNYMSKSGEELINSCPYYGYVVDSLEIALRGFFKYDTFEDGLINIVNLGNDADTNACIYGYLAGAYYGYNNIPSKRKDNITNKDLISNIANRLLNEGL